MHAYAPAPIHDIGVWQRAWIVVQAKRHAGVPHGTQNLLGVDAWLVRGSSAEVRYGVRESLTMEQSMRQHIEIEPTIRKYLSASWHGHALVYAADGSPLVPEVNHTRRIRPCAKRSAGCLLLHNGRLEAKP